MQYDFTRPRASILHMAFKGVFVEAWMGLGLVYISKESERASAVSLHSFRVEGGI